MPSEWQGMQERIIQGMKEFEAENPAITEAMTVMNMTMPDYYLAMESIRGGQIITASAHAAFPFQVRETA